MIITTGVLNVDRVYIKNKTEQKSIMFFSAHMTLSHKKVYTGKQLKDIRIILTVFLLKKKFQKCSFVSDRHTTMRFSKV